jgi:hypothetical protein
MNRRDKARSKRLPYHCRAVAAVPVGGVRGEKREVERTGGGPGFKGSRGAAAALAETGHFDSRFRRRQCVVCPAPSRATPHTPHLISLIPRTLTDLVPRRSLWVSPFPQCITCDVHKLAARMQSRGDHKVQQEREGKNAHVWQFREHQDCMTFHSAHTTQPRHLSTYKLLFAIVGRCRIGKWCMGLCNKGATRPLGRDIRESNQSIV